MSLARYLSKLGALLNSDGKITADAIAAGAIPASDDASALTTGTVGTARLGSGTASSSTYLRGDQTWAAVSSGVTSITAGNGLTGGTITSSGTIALDFYTGTTANNTSYPIGSYIKANGANYGAATLNASVTMKVFLNGGQYTIACNYSGGGSAFSGTWRCRGGDQIDCNYYHKGVLAQRVA